MRKDNELLLAADWQHQNKDAPWWMLVVVAVFFGVMLSA